MRETIVVGYHGGDSAEGALGLGSAIGWRTGARAVDAGAPATGLAHTAHDEGARLVVLGPSATPTIAAQLAEAVTCPIAVAPCRQS